MSKKTPREIAEEVILADDKILQDIADYAKAFKLGQNDSCVRHAFSIARALADACEAAIRADRRQRGEE